MAALISYGRRRKAGVLAFIRERSGLAAVEFALILPMMVVMFFGMLEASDLFTVNRRLANAANSLVDLAAHDPTITRAQLDDMMVGVTRILEPTDTSTVVMRVISIQKGPDAASAPTVHWSRDDSGGQPYATGSPYTKLIDNTTLNANSSMMVVEVEYTYQTGYTGRIFTFPFEFKHTAKRWPRRSPKVQLCASADPATCTT